jgi:predicted DNA-binding protein (UPF0251 family)
MNEGLSRFDMENQAIQKRIAAALERIADAVEGGKQLVLNVTLDGKALTEQVVKSMPRVLADRRRKPKSKPKPRQDVSHLSDEQLEVIRLSKRRVRMDSVWHRKAGKAGVMVVTVVGRGVTHAILNHRDTGKDSRSRYDYFATGIEGVHPQWQKGEPSK